MFMFCGDSHSRQFHMDVSGQVSFTSFSGATLKGLAADAGRIRHHRSVLDLAALRRRKTLLIMFGNVDLDVTYFRKLALEGAVDEEVFFSQRLQILGDYVDLCMSESGRYIERLCFLLPQVSPLADDHFIDPTATMAKVTVEEMTRVVETNDCSHLARCRRTIAFNDYVTSRWTPRERIELHRIDRGMVDETGLILPQFISANRNDHHPARLATLPLWYESLQDAVRVFKKFHLRRSVHAAPVVADPA